MLAIATTQGLLGLVAVNGSLYPAVTVVLAILILKERPQFAQGIGVSLALIGVVLISAGFDSRTGDPLGRFRVTDAGFQRLTQILLQIAKDSAQGRLISALEGGYSLEGLSNAVPAHIATLMKE